ncbi:unnamed protein product, partial [Prorocentrum cordatum]
RTNGPPEAHEQSAALGLVAHAGAHLLRTACPVEPMTAGELVAAAAASGSRVLGAATAGTRRRASASRGRRPGTGACPRAPTAAARGGGSSAGTSARARAEVRRLGAGRARSAEPRPCGRAPAAAARWKGGPSSLLLPAGGEGRGGRAAGARMGPCRRGTAAWGTKAGGAMGRGGKAGETRKGGVTKTRAKAPRGRSWWPRRRRAPREAPPEESAALCGARRGSSARPGENRKGPPVVPSRAATAGGAVASAFRRQPRGHDRNGARSGARIGAPEGPAGATSLPGGPPAARRRASCQGPPPRLSLRWGVGAEGHARLNSMGPRLRPWFVPPCARDLWLELSARHARGGAIPALPIWGQRLCTCSLPPRASHFICASACSDEFQICHRICRRGRATLSAPPRAATNFSPSRKKFQLRRGLRGYTVATVRAETRPAPRAGRAGRACAKKAARPCTTVPCQGHPWALAWCTAGPTRPSSKPKTPSGNAKIRTGSFSRAGGQSSPPQSS